MLSGTLLLETAFDPAFAGQFLISEFKEKGENLGGVREKGYTFVAWSPRKRVHF